MKLILATIPFSFAAPQAAQQELSPNDICMKKVADIEESGNCEKTDRTLFAAKSLIGLINCPNGESSADVNPACAGGYAWWDSQQTGDWLSYDENVANALRNYGCNCFPKNKWINRNVFGLDWPHVMTGVNGEPLDDVDAACTILAKRVKCLDIDFNSMELKDWPNSNNGQPRDTCDYIQWYNTFDEGSGVTCGYAENPNYADASNWWYKPENIGFHNMNQCRNTICEAEMEFARIVAPLLVDPVQFAKNNNGNKGAWEKGMCQMQNHNLNLDSCCGDKFERSPFDSSVKVCCDGKITDTGNC